jgi:hypothetical protein
MDSIRENALPGIRWVDATRAARCNEDCRRIPASSHGRIIGRRWMTRDCPAATARPLAERRSAGKVTPAPRIRSAGYACLRSEPSNFPQSTPRDRPGAFRLRSAPSGLPQTCKTPARGSCAGAAGGSCSRHPERDSPLDSRKRRKTMVRRRDRYVGCNQQPPTSSAISVIDFHAPGLKPSPSGEQL